jgi:hypothetical protein
MNRITNLKAFLPHFPPMTLVLSPSRPPAWPDRPRRTATLAQPGDRKLDDNGVRGAGAIAEAARHD